MQDATSLLGRLPLPAWAAALVALGASALLAHVVRALLERLAMRLARRKDARAAEVLIGALRLSVTALLFLLGVQISLQVAELPGRWGTVPPKVVAVLTILVAAYGFGHGVLSLMREYTPLSSRLAPLSGILTGLTRALIGTVALLLALDSLGISARPLLASLGVGSVAVALALQETLGNFFAGVAILADHPVRVGELVKVEPDLEGRVVGIGWRATSLVDLNNNLVVLPNATLARAIIRNYDRPTPSETVPIRVVVEHGTPLEAALAATRAAVEPLGGGALVTAIEPPGIEITASVPVDSRLTRGAVRSQALMAIAAALAHAGISPARAVPDRNPTAR